jgi:hypothetical protein
MIKTGMKTTDEYPMRINKYLAKQGVATRRGADELGIAILGFSKMRVKYFAMLSFVFNFLGITVIGLIARSLTI